MEPTEPTNQDYSFQDVKNRLEQLNKIQEILARLVSTGQGTEAAQVFHAGQNGQMLAEDVLRLYEGKKTLDVSLAKPGDVVWWKSEKGTTGYFRVSESEKPDSISGAVRMVKDDGTVSREYADAYLQGAGFGMIKTGCIAENMPLWFTIPRNLDPSNVSDEQFTALPDDEQSKYFPKQIHTSPVIEIGLIKNEALSQEL